MNHYVKQHLIDPELCIRCNACLEVCPAEAIEFDGVNYLVDPARCDDQHDCRPGCPTGAIEAFRVVAAGRPYSLADQSAWSRLPELEEAGCIVVDAPGGARASMMTFGLQAPAQARIVGNRRLTGEAASTDIREIILSFGDAAFGIIEGQSVGVLPPGTDHNGHPHHMRAYSLASPRDGETPGDGRVPLVVKRVLDEWQGTPYRGVASNHLCDSRIGDSINCVGPIGESFRLPVAPRTRLLMICTGTGVAPMWGFIRRRLREGLADAGAMMLFYGGRAPHEMAYHDELATLPAGAADIRFAYSRKAGEPKRYVQDLLTESTEEIGNLLDDPAAHIYVCGLRQMEAGVIEAFAAICETRGLDWAVTRERLRLAGRLHFETY